MNAGLLLAFNTLQLNGSGTATATASDTGNGVGATANALYQYAPTGTGLSTWAQFSLLAELAVTSGAQTATATLTVAGKGSWTDTGSTGTCSASISDSFEIDFTSGGFYALAGGAFELVYSSLTIKLGGVTRYTEGANSIVVNSRFAPSALPVLGIPCLLEAGCAPAAVPVPSVPTGTAVESHSYTGNSSVTAGWRWQAPGSSTWQSLPVDYQFFGGTPVTCSCAPETGSTISATDTSAGTVTGGFTLSDNTVLRGGGPIACDCVGDNVITVTQGLTDVYDRTIDYNNWNAQLCLVPNLPRSVKRMGTDYAEIIQRGGIPACSAVYASSCQDYVSGTGPVTSSDTTQIVPSYGSALNTVGVSPHSIEAPMSATIYAPYISSQTRVYGLGTATVTLVLGQCAYQVIGTNPDGPSDDTPSGTPPPPPPCFPIYAVACGSSVTSSYWTVEDASTNTALLGGLYNDQAIARYVDYVACPHWSYGVFFPASVTSGAVQPYEWPINGNHANPPDYWWKAKQQYLSNPALPTAEARQTRTDILAEPLTNSGLSGAAVGLFGNNTAGWWGVTRFKALNITLPGSVAMTQSETAPWTFTDCTAAFGSSEITLTPTGSPTTVKATLALGSFDNPPCQILALIQQILVNWSGSGISSAAVTLVGGDGSSAVIGTAPGTYEWPASPTDNKYGGTWGQDFSCGYSVTDTGADVPTGGESSFLMGSNQGVFDFELLLGNTAAKLEFGFDLSDPTQTITLDYPSFTLPGTVPAVVPETAMTFALIWPNGPGVRYGQWSWWGSAFQDPPVVRPFGQPPSALDALCFANVVLAGQVSTTNLSTVIATLYDAVEGQTQAAVASGTNSFPILASGTLTLILVSGLAECPPLCQLPLPTRGTNFQPTGSLAQEAWTHAQEGKYLICPRTPADMFDGAGAEWTAPSGVSVAGWSVEAHHHPLTNNATTDAIQIKQAGKEYATALPWHGYFSVLTVTPGELRDYDVSRWLGHARAFINPSTNTLWLGFASNAQPTLWSDKDTGIAVQFVAIRWQDTGSQQPLGVFSCTGTTGDLLFAQTYGLGATFTSPMTIATIPSGRQLWSLDFEECPDGYRKFYWLLDDGTVYASVLDRDLNVQQAAAATNLTGLTQGDIRARSSINPNGGQTRLGLMFASGGSLNVEFAYDNYTFS